MGVCCQSRLPLTEQFIPKWNRCNLGVRLREPRFMRSPVRFGCREKSEPMHSRLSVENVG